jgi:hypothetical protein
MSAYASDRFQVSCISLARLSLRNIYHSILCIFGNVFVTISYRISEGAAANLWQFIEQTGVVYQFNPRSPQRGYGLCRTLQAISDALDQPAIKNHSSIHPGLLTVNV